MLNDDMREKCTKGIKVHLGDELELRIRRLAEADSDRPLSAYIRNVLLDHADMMEEDKVFSPSNDATPCNPIRTMRVVGEAS